MTRIFLLACLCAVLLSCSPKEKSPAANLNRPSPQTSTPSPTPAPTVEDIAWQSDYDAFVKRAQHVATFEEVSGAAPVFTGRNVNWAVTYRRIHLFKPRPEAVTPNAAPEYQIDFDEGVASEKETPWVDVRARLGATERASFEKLKPGTKITMQCRVTFSTRATKTGTSALGVFLNLEGCVLTK